MHLFSRREALAFGWETFKAHWKFFVGMTFLVGLATTIPSEMSQSLTKKITYVNSQGVEAVREQLTLASLVVGIFAGYVSFLVQLGAIRIGLKFVDGEIVQFKDALQHLKSPFMLVLQLFFASLLYGVIVFIGFVLLIIPGIVWAIKYRFYPFFLLERRVGIWESLRLSAKATQGAKMDLFVFGLLMGLVILFGALFFGVGLLAAIPTTMLAYVFVYRRLELHLRASEVKSEEVNALEQWKVKEEAK